MRSGTVVANLLISGSTLPRTIRWWRQTRQVTSTQTKVLQGILGRHAETEFGRNHGFSTIRTVDEFRQRIPIMDGADLGQYVRRMQHPADRVLTADRVLRLVPTSGSTEGPKFIPYTAQLLQDFQAAIDPWLASLMARNPRLIGGTAYWQITPVSRRPLDAAEVPTGFGDDSEYLGSRRSRILQNVFAVPESVAKLANLDDYRYATLRHLLAHRDLAFISVWNPSFLTLLLDALPSVITSVSDDIRRGTISRMRDVAPTPPNPRRAAELQRLFDDWDGLPTSVDQRDRTIVERLWPNLRVVSCWTDASARHYADALQRRLPHVQLEPKGLVATECIVTFPWTAAEHPLAVGSHFFEFQPVTPDGITTDSVLAHELKAGATYEVVVTTNGGLYRYALRDHVRVTGYVRGCPCLRFIGRSGGVVDLVGEKLSPEQVQTAVAENLTALGCQPEFWLVAPDHADGQSGYTLYLHGSINDAELSRLAGGIDRQLGLNPHYQYARDLGQLRPLRIFRIADSARPAGIYTLCSNRTGVRWGSVKPPVLDGHTGWSTIFPGAFAP